MASHRLAEERSLALHREIAKRVRNDPRVLERARARVARWLETGDVSGYWAEEWRAVLSRSIEEICAFLVDEGEYARAMRQMTPFAGVIDPRTRWRIWREVRDALETTG
jgi:hypothetical protein